MNGVLDIGGLQVNKKEQRFWGMLLVLLFGKIIDHIRNYLNCLVDGRLIRKERGKRSMIRKCLNCLIERGILKC